MLNLGPFSTRSHKFTLTATETEGRTPTHPIRQEPHLYRPKRNSNFVTQEGRSRWSNRGGGILPPPQGTGLSDLEDRKQQVCSDSIRRAREDPATSRTGLKTTRFSPIHIKPSNQNLFQAQ